MEKHKAGEKRIRIIKTGDWKELQHCQIPLQREPSQLMPHTKISQPIDAILFHLMHYWAGILSAIEDWGQYELCSNMYVAIHAIIPICSLTWAVWPSIIFTEAFSHDNEDIVHQVLQNAWFNRHMYSVCILPTYICTGGNLYLNYDWVYVTFYRINAGTMFKA